MAAPVTNDQELELRIDSLAYGGNGVARLNGFVVFVRRGLPGDTVRARVTKVKRNHAEAVSLAVVEPGAPRVEAPCAHYPDCGGCRFQDLAYDAQLAAKAQQVGDALARIGGFRASSSSRPCRPSRLPLPEQARVLVYHARRRDGRPRLPPRRPLGRGARRRALLAHDRPRERDPRGGQGVGSRRGPCARTTRRRRRGYLRHLVVREGRNTGQALVVLVTAPGELGGGERARRGATPVPGGALDPLGRERIPGRGHEPAHDAPVGRGGDRGGDPRPALPPSPERLPADEHGHVRGPLPARAASTPVSPARRPCTTSTAERGRSGSPSPATRLRCGGSSPRRSRSPARSRTRS